MKIVCGSCGAKYSIADEKVAGKTFKIRCRKCNAAILVDGTSVSGDSGGEEATAYDPGLAAIWHVVMGGEQQGPFPVQQIGSYLESRQLQWEDYVWREGFDDWKTVEEVPELSQAFAHLKRNTDASPSPSAEETGSAVGESASETGFSRDSSAADSSAAFAGAGASSAGSSAFGASSSSSGTEPLAAAATGGHASSASRASSAGSDIGRSSFGGSTAGARSSAASSASRASSAGGRASSAGGGMFAAAASTPATGSTAGSGAMTGERNENSVLFSLNNLQNLAGQSGGAGSSSGSSASSNGGGIVGQASGEGSGLIDIRSIADAAKHMHSDSSSSTKNDIDDLLSIGTGGINFASPLTAPVVAEPEEEPPKATNKGPMVVMVSAAVIAAVAAVAALFFVFTRAGGEGEDATAAGAETPGQVAGLPGDANAGAQPAEAGGDPSGGQDTAEANAGSAEPSGTTSSKSEKSRGKKGKGRKVASAGSKNEKSTPSKESASSSSDTGSSKKKGGGDIDDLLEAALGGKKKKGGSSSSDSGGLKNTPSRSDVLTALKRVSPGVKACGAGKSGVVNAKVTVKGSTGRVSSVGISGPFAGTPVGSCASRVIKRARFPKFKQSSFTIARFPYKI